MARMGAMKSVTVDLPYPGRTVEEVRAMLG